MALPIRQISRKHILAALLLLALTFCFTAAAAADDPDPEVYQPDGVGTLFQGVDLQQGQAPTLYEKYPDSAWSTDWKSRGWTHMVDNTVDPVLNGITNVLLGATRAVTGAAISFSYQMADFDAFSLLSTQMTDMVRTVANSAIDWLLPTCLALGAVLVLGKMAVGTGEGLRQFGALILAGSVGVSLAVIPELWTESINAVRQVGASTTAAATSQATTDLKVPFEGPTPSFGNDEGINTHRKQGDAIWRTYVATPWCIAEFGNLRTCQDYGEEILSLSGDERSDYIDSNEFKDALGGDKSAAWQMTTGQDGATRMAILLPALIVAVIFCGLVIFLNATVLLYLMLALMLLVAGVFFAMMWVIPGKPRQWGMAWAEKLFGFTFMSFIANIVLMVTMLVSMTTMGLAGSYGWGVSALLTIVAAIASVLLFRHLKEIMGVGSTGALAAMGTGAALGMMGSRLGRGIKKRLPHRKASTPENGTAGQEPFPGRRSERPRNQTGPSNPRPTGKPAQPTGSKRPGGSTTPSRRRKTTAGQPVAAVGTSVRLAPGPHAAGASHPEQLAWRGGKPRDEDLPSRRPSTPPPVVSANTPQPGPRPAPQPARSSPHGTETATPNWENHTNMAPGQSRPTPQARPAPTSQPAGPAPAADKRSERQMPSLSGPDAPWEKDKHGRSPVRRRRSDDGR